MADGKKMLDESFSKEALRKSLEGTTGTRPALRNIQISPSGQVQPRPSSPSQPGSSTSTSGGSQKS